jgi:hypothetical protein
MSYSQLAARLREHWLEAASVRNVLIVGWGVAAGLHSLRGAHKILVRASIAVRERNIKRQLRFAHLGTASLELESQDAAARIYMQRLFGADWLDPDLYDVAIDMDAMSPGKARAVIGALTCNPLHVGPSPSRCEIERALEAVASNTEDQPLTWLGARSTDWLKKRPPEVPRFPRMDLRDRERDDPQPDDPVPGDMGWWEDFLPPEQAG